MSMISFIQKVYNTIVLTSIIEIPLKTSFYTCLIIEDDKTMDLLQDSIISSTLFKNQPIIRNVKLCTDRLVVITVQHSVMCKTSSLSKKKLGENGSLQKFSLKLPL